MAGTTGLEPATSAVTGQRSNQLNYVPTSLFMRLAPKPHVYCRFPLSANSRASALSSRYIEVPGRNGKPWIAPSANFRTDTDNPAPERLSLPVIEL
jgi:hypothetical protein